MTATSPTISSVAHLPLDPRPSQLLLPTGPTHVLRGRRDPTDEDRNFMSMAFKVKAGGIGATAVFRCLAYYASLSSRRVAYPSQRTIARYCDMSDRQVRRILPKLEEDGWIVCVSRKQGACSSTYQIARTGHGVLLEPDMVSYEEGRKVRDLKEKALSLDDTAQLPASRPGALPLTPTS